MQIKFMVEMNKCCIRFIVFAFDEGQEIEYRKQIDQFPLFLFLLSIVINLMRFNILQVKSIK